MKRWIVCCVSLAVFAPASAGAAPITFLFTGHVTQVAALDPASPFPDPVDVGTPFSGRFRFDGASPDLVPLDAQTGSYTSSGTPYGIRLSLAGLTFAFPSVNIGVLNDYAGPTDYYLVTFAESAGPGNPTGTLVELTLIDDSGTAFSGDALPLLPPALGDFLVRSFLFTDTILGNQVEIGGEIESLVVKAAPEPSTMLLLVLPAVGLIRRRLRARG